MKNILTIFKKEWDRVIKDKRLVITIMILPGLMIFLVYTFIGNAMSNLTSQDVYDIAIVNPQPDFTSLYQLDPNYDSWNIIEIDDVAISEYELKIDEQDWRLLIVFDEAIATYDGGDDKPTVTLYSNPNDTASNDVNNSFEYYLSVYEEYLSTEYYGDSTYFQVIRDGMPLDDTEFMGKIIASLLPMLMIMFLFSGAMSIGPESIAGEKERGTIATLLVTPVNRREIAIGKVLALSVLSLISATSSFIGIMFSLPTLLNFGSGMSADIYHLSDYLMILLVLFSTVFIIVGVISIISAYAKNLKEASTLIMPIYILTILVSVSSMFSEGANTNLFVYILPIYNTVQTLTAILTFDPAALTYLLITVVVNIMYLTVFIIILNKMFNSEKIMFAK